MRETTNLYRILPDVISNEILDKNVMREDMI
jgi:hypothetical protein